MTSTRRHPEDPDDAGFILQRKRFRVTKPSSQQSGATSAERPIPVWRVVRHVDFPSPYQLSVVGRRVRLALKVESPPPGSSLLGGRLRPPRPPPPRKWGWPTKGHVLAKGGKTPQRGKKVPFFGIPHWSPGPCIGHPLGFGGAV
ncbi:hypothetical protein GWK47_019842 [Chionoecetes opilio]|uniref:Uncharacterized protein n=1 Tax=Chionoecetes opilio TaxID=41210 RepID=A0A8J5CL40_CHIOP|nr:hypothetical protein GWK47_019842 [Chionoecetes opilio]